MIKHITINTDKLRAKLSTLPRFMQQIALPAAGDIAVTEIKDTSAHGTNVKGIALKPYTDPYKQLKERLIGSAEPVNLRLSNDMMNSLQYFSLTKNRGEVNVSAEEYPKALGNSRKRKFIMKSKPMILKIKTDLTPKLKTYLS